MRPKTFKIADGLAARGEMGMFAQKRAIGGSLLGIE